MAKYLAVFPSLNQAALIKRAPAGRGCTALRWPIERWARAKPAPYVSAAGHSPQRNRQILPYEPCKN